MNAPAHPLSDLFAIGSSKRVLKSQWEASGVPFYRGREITELAENGAVDNELFISEERYLEYSQKFGCPRPGDIMITAIGTIGNSYIVRDTDRFYFKDASVLWMARKSDSFDSEFINYWLKSDGFREQLDTGNGATVDTLTIQKLQRVRIPIPPVAEQRRIVRILDEAFDGLARARANSKSNLENARSVLAARTSVLFGRPDPSWPVVNFGEMATFRNGINFTKSSRGDSVRIVGVKDFADNATVPFDSLALVVTDGKLAESDRIRRDDILFVRSNGSLDLIGRCLLVEDVPEPTAHSGFTIRARLTRNDIRARYLCRVLRSDIVRARMVAGGIGANIKSLSQGVLASLEIPVPPLAVQERVSAELDELERSADRLADIYSRKIAAIDRLKKSLLHHAFAGKL